MHLRSITMKGFKSFPDRTRLEFTPGVSVIVGPNGCGKSNVTDAVLWALGEQSPLAVRGQTMQDVIFSGAPGVASRNTAEVEVVIDDAERELGTEFTELAITRRLDRSGDGEYRLNGARCRLVDVLEALSDTGLGKEMHSVVSQGRVEGVIHSSPRERRLLIEEAAGLGKHRKRRRRAELKLARTEDNLARALDVERESRSRLRPLKRQAEAADLHERLERQSLEARLELSRDGLRAAAEQRSEAEAQARSVRERRADAERRLGVVAERRERIEQALAEHGRAREELSRRVFSATTAADRVELRLERVRETARAATDEARRLRAELGRLEAVEGRVGGEAADGDRAGDGEGEAASGRIAGLEAELAALDARDAHGPDEELDRLRNEREEADRERAALEDTVAARRADLATAESATEPARATRRQADATLESARAEALRLRAELDAVVHLARSAAPAPGRLGALAEHLTVEPGYELALAAALGPLVRAGLAEEVEEASTLLDAKGAEGASVLVQAAAWAPSDPPALPEPPVPGAERLLDRVRPDSRVAAPVARLLADAWVVESIAAVPPAFAGLAVTRAGRALAGRTGELRQAVAGADERLLERLSRRDELAAAERDAARRATAAEGEAQAAAAAHAAAERERDRAADALRQADRAAETAEEAARAAARAVTRREAAADETLAVRRAEIAAELRAERRMLERVERERVERRRRLERMRGRVAHDEEIERAAAAVAPALETALAAVGEHREALRAELDADQAAGARIGEELRACAREEAELQGELRAAGELVTEAEVRAQRSRDAAEACERELREVAGRLARGRVVSEPDADDQAQAAAANDEGGSPTDAGPGDDAPQQVDPAQAGDAPAQVAALPAGQVALPDPLPEPLSTERRAELAGLVQRLARRREKLGPVNPLAKHDYEEAIAHVEELESQRRDLEAALAELQGIIRETDRRIRESFEQTFEATARNFEEVVEDLFPGGRGRLRLVSPDGPRPVLGGADGDEEGAARAGSDGDDSDEPESSTAPADREPGVEVEVTPAGKSMRRLSLMSGGERSLVALAFLFAVFLARPCPFYVLDEVEAALDDLNIDRFLRLVRRCSDRAQFIVVTHQKRTMDAADCLYGVSMGGDGISKVISRRLPAPFPEAAVAGADVAA